MTIGIIQYHLFWFVAHIMVSTHAVAQAYDFTASGGASYDIPARNTFYIVNSDSTISTLVAKADSHSANISGKLVVARPTLVKRATFNGCTLSQKSELLIGAHSYTQSHTSATPRYTTWFGDYTPARHSTVVSHFSNISGNRFLSYKFDCTCTNAGTFAYVYPDEYVLYSPLQRL